MKRTPFSSAPDPRAGFTLVEVVMASAVALLVSAAALTMYFLFANAYALISVHARAASGASHSIERFAYNMDGEGGLRSLDGEAVSIQDQGNDGWTIDLGLDDEGDSRTIQYDAQQGQIVNQLGEVLVQDVTAASAILTNNGMLVEVSVRDSRRDFEADSTMRSFVFFRN